MSDEPSVVPQDEHNAVLVANAHPADWQNPEPDSCYNMVVIGAGPAGLVAAAGAAGLGAKVALVERHLMGGDCLNFGCVPSKCLVRSSRAAADMRDAVRFGVGLSTGPEVDFPAVMERMRRLRAKISRNDSVERFNSLGVDIFLGEGRFVGRHAVEVGGKTLNFNKGVIASGARAYVPPINGLADVGCLTNETVFSLTEKPDGLAVLGAGPLGCELAQAFNRLGCKVTLIHNHEHILNREDDDAAEIVERALKSDGIRLLLNCDTVGVESKDGRKVIRFEQNGKESTIEVGEILIASGRAPNVEGMNLEAAGVEYDASQGVLVDERLRTSNADIYAAGDICLKYKFTHTADATARIVLQNALFMGRKRTSALTVPWCTYTDPEIAHVGMYKEEAEEKGVETDVYTRRMRDVDRAIADGEEDGFVKIITRKGTDVIVGATIVARHAGEMISEITLAIVGNVGLGTLSNVIHPYPTQAEAIKHLADEYSRTRLTPRVRKMFEKWQALGRRCRT
ncbi:mercuric reductase [Candidatus Hydrogenedentota bacterium]